MDRRPPPQSNQGPAKSIYRNFPKNLSAKSLNTNKLAQQTQHPNWFGQTQGFLPLPTPSIQSLNRSPSYSTLLNQQKIRNAFEQSHQQMFMHGYGYLYSPQYQPYPNQINPVYAYRQPSSFMYGTTNGPVYPEMNLNNFGANGFGMLKQSDMLYSCNNQTDGLSQLETGYIQNEANRKFAKAAIALSKSDSFMITF